MFLGHLAVGLAGKRAAPSVSLATWFVSVQFVDLLWPAFLLAGVEQVRIEPGITAFSPLDFTRYPVTHSLAGGIAWAAVFAGVWLTATTVRTSRHEGPASRSTEDVAPASDKRRLSNSRIAALLAAGVLSHWVLDVISHRPDMPVLPSGPLVGLGLWNSVAATLVVELALFAAGLFLYVRSGAPGARRISFWLLMALLLVLYLATAFGPPPPDTRTLALSALLAWLFVPFAWWADRRAEPDRLSR